MKKCSYTGLVLGLVLAIQAVSANSSLVSADACAAQLGYSVSSMYDNTNVQMVVPVSATCSFTGGQLYAVGNILDTSRNSNVGSASTMLTAVYGGNTFNGQLVFNILPLMQGDPLQVSVSIYNVGLNGSILTTATETLQVPSNYYYNYPSNYCSGYNCYPSYPSTPSYPSYPTYPPYPHYRHCYYPGGYYYCHYPYP